jgi:cytochrome P450
MAGRTASFSEYRGLRYTQMVLYETLRLYPTVPSFPRLSVKRSKLGDYDIPAGTVHHTLSSILTISTGTVHHTLYSILTITISTGTLVVVSQQPMNRDERIWGTDAHLFNPERFDDGEGLPLPQLRPTKPVGVPGGGHSFGFVPFGAGQRTCVGQRLAVMEGTMILAGTINRLCFE